LPTSTDVNWPAQPGQRAASSADSLRALAAPHFEQNAAPANISAKQDGQETVASRDLQNGQRGAEGSAGDPQLGQRRTAASAMGYGR
jgi:hypothetical protein